MKEAAGEANMTIITIVLIAIVLAAGTLIVNGIMGNVKNNSCCQSIGGQWTGGECLVNGKDAKDDAGFKSCKSGKNK